MQKRWGFGLGSVFSLIIVFFIYLYSRDRVADAGSAGWVVLEFVTKWYLIIWVAIVVIFMAVVLLGLISGFFVSRKVRRHMRKMDKDVIDAEYRIKE